MSAPSPKSPQKKPKSAVPPGPHTIGELVNFMRQTTAIMVGIVEEFASHFGMPHGPEAYNTAVESVEHSAGLKRPGGGQVSPKQPGRSYTPAQKAKMSAGMRKFWAKRKAEEKRRRDQAMKASQAALKAKKKKAAEAKRATRTAPAAPAQAQG